MIQGILMLSRTQPYRSVLLLLKCTKDSRFFDNDRIALNRRRDLASQLLGFSRREYLDAGLVFEKPDCSALDARNGHPVIRVFFLHLLDSSLRHRLSFLKATGTGIRTAGKNTGCAYSANVQQNNNNPPDH